VAVPPDPDDRQLALHADLVAALPGSRFVRYDLDPGSFEQVLALPGVAAACLTRHPWKGLRWTHALAADPSDPDHIAAAVGLAVRLVDEAGEGDPVLGITVPRGGLALLPERIRPAEVSDWDCWATLVSPEPASDVVVVDLPADDPRLAALLDLASPDAPYPAGDPRVVRWAALLDPDGGLEGTGGLACMVAVTRQRSGAAHLNDVATHPERRGRGLARLLCAAVTRDALAAGAPAVTLDTYADNDAASRLYTSLGFTRERGSTTGRIPRA
jgi:GNAT superfamily N-acetyltransferase